ncbi:fimbrial assembly chaperone [Escherichia sp. E2593]|uniref:fimbrial assembly chaperone n=1 Tax=unclassified Escherichia TaxID=2608889 RepID=UPI001028F73D|nr:MULTISPECIES: fimbrial assembly chaperone [unclassified Escherichia]RZN37640.1 fimbrial assembly chaperone [Escherichia sp. E10V5]TLI77299.1 fimbrial assembly chaperone [Escherichia sp. E2593]
MKKLIAFLLAGMVTPAWGGVYIYGTRVIYPEQKKEITVQLMNEGNRSALVQSWIDDGDTSLPPEKIHVPFVLTPPVAHVKGGEGQQLKIKKLANTLPKDRESLFFLNVLDIPPNCPELEDKNGIKFAMQNRIKFIYRPEGLTGVDKKSFRRLSIKNANGGINIKNNSANWITIPELTGNAKINKETLLLAPWSDKTITTASAINQYTITLIDDNGNYLSEKVKTVK